MNTPAGLPPPVPSGFAPAGRPVAGLRPLTAAEPLLWLQAGWRDFRRAPGIGLFYGLCFFGMGWAIQLTFVSRPAWMLALAAGFLLVGPFLCLGLYETSRRFEAGEPQSLGASLMAWDRHFPTLAIYGFSLLVIEMLWARAAMVVFAVSFSGVHEYRGPLATLADPANLGFVIAYLVVGAVFAAIIYAMTVVAMPMILHRGVDAITAALISIRLVLARFVPMLLWAALVAVVIGVSLLPAFAGVIVAGPVIGFASWHAYRRCIAWSDEPETAGGQAGAGAGAGAGAFPAGVSAAISPAGVSAAAVSPAAVSSAGTAPALSSAAMSPPAMPAAGTTIPPSAATPRP